MKRYYLTTYLTTKDCYQDEECLSKVGELWHNAINGESCYIPYEVDLELTTYCHVFYELGVEPPALDGYDSDYAVYLSFRNRIKALQFTNEPLK